jgi:putative acetyltransferase
MLSIREEKLKDIPAIRKVNEKAFNGLIEASLVDLLRETNKITISLVATLNDKVVGHILFSPVTIESNPGNLRGIGLAPLSVLPELQNRGIGLSLVIQGLIESRKKGYDLVFVLGDKNYYSRFGFKPAILYDLSNEYQADESFMVVELRKGALNAVSGLVKYQPEFNEPDS